MDAGSSSGTGQGRNSMDVHLCPRMCVSWLVTE